MGLDITAYEHAALYKPATDDCDYENGTTRIYNQPPYDDRRDGLEPGIYRVSGETLDDIRFSYSGYSRFRNILSWVFLGVAAQTAWDFPDLYKDKPAFKLIEFFDNEGTIGPKTSAALAECFAQYRDAFMASDRVDDWDRAAYDKLAAAFKLASVDGVVRFH